MTWGSCGKEIWSWRLVEVVKKVVLEILQKVFVGVVYAQRKGEKERGASGHRACERAHWSSRAAGAHAEGAAGGIRRKGTGV